MNALSETWEHEDHEVLHDLCRTARVPELLANIPWRQISEGFRKKLQEAWEKRGSDVVNQ